MTLPLFLFAVLAIFLFVMVALALAGARNAREIAQLLDVVPHRPVTMSVMLLSLAPSAGLAVSSAYLLVWPEGRHRIHCLAGAGIALLLAAALFWSPLVVRLWLAFSNG